MPAYVIAHIDVHHQEPYERYKMLAPESIAAHGGRYLARAGETRVLEGTLVPKRLVILEFPSFARAEEWWSSAAYRDAKALRQSCSTGDLILIDGTR